MIACQVPRRDIRPRMPDHNDAGKHLRNAIEVFLIGETLTFQAVEAPLITAIAPPAHHRQSVRIVAKRQPAYVVQPVDLALPLRLREPMGYQAHRVVSQFLVQAFRAGEKIQIAIDVRDGLSCDTAPQNELYERWR